LKKITPLILILFIFPKLLTAWTLNLQETEAGRATGTLTVNNEITQFSFAYAVSLPGFFDRSKEDILVILTDVPLPEKAIEDNFERSRMMHDGNLHGIELIIDANRNPISVTILHNAFNAPPSGRGYEVFEAKTIDTKIIEGKIYTSKENEFFNTTYEYSATFNAAIRREVLPTEAEKEAASKSQQASAYLEYEKAIKASDFDGLKKLVTPEISKEMSMDEASEMFEFMQMTMPQNVEFIRVKVDGQKATLEMSAEEDGQKITGKVYLLLDGKQWKVGENSWKY
jgi:hypothetical protein